MKNILVLTIIILVATFSTSCQKDKMTFKVARHRVGDTTFAVGTYYFPITPGQQYEEIKDKLIPSYIEYLSGGSDNKNSNPNDTNNTSRGDRYLCGKWVSIELSNYTIVNSGPNCPEPHLHFCLCNFKVGLKKLYSPVISTTEASSEEEAIELVIEMDEKYSHSEYDSTWVVRPGDHTGDYKWDRNDPQCY
ncbi:MAG: hypothetical protein WC564_04755 [Patescibacteria group bacterium]